jgi:threonine dehydratase
MQGFMTTAEHPLPAASDVEANRRDIAQFITRTPVALLQGASTERVFGSDTEIFLKLENFQTTGSFKVRSVLTFVHRLAPKRRERGLVTISSGNHALAVAYAARVCDTTAKVVVLRSAVPRKIELCRCYGAEVVLVDSIDEAEARVKAVEAAEGRVFVPAWGDPALPLGTGSIGLEILEQVPGPDAVLVGIGAGSTCAGVASVIKERRPGCRVFGVEPKGAPTTWRSLRSGRVEHIEAVATIADGLAPPVSCEYFVSIFRRVLDDLRLVTDEQIVHAMCILFDDMNLAIEPAGAAALAGAMGPYRDEIEGSRCVVIVSGSNIDLETFARLLSGA